MQLPRIMLTAPASGSGKTLITCGIMQALVDRKRKVASFKCGPDYIDPMFHKRVIGTESKNLDTFFTEDNMTRYLFGSSAKDADISIIEGVMGYYDGIAGITTRASSYELAKVIKAPAILVIDAKGMSLSVVAMLKGFMTYKEDSNIVGVILNQTSKGIYPILKQAIEEELAIKVLGYVPSIPDCRIESRHLGLVTPEEIVDLKGRLEKLAKALEETVDLDGLLELAAQAPELDYEKPYLPKGFPKKTIRVGVTKDEAFCFLYRDNLALLEEMGAELVYFSPLHEQKVPDNLDGMLLCGGYPELYAKDLSENESMKASIREALERIPYMAECGGFMYLHSQMEDMEKKSWPMAGVLPGSIIKTDHLCRFGYITLSGKKENLLGDGNSSVRGHEFHYYDSTDNGEDYTATKPGRNRQYDCILADQKRVVGFPHLYYYSNPEVVYEFLKACKENRGEESK